MSTATIEPLPGERPRAYQALLDYAKMDRRSLAELHAQYRGIQRGGKEGTVPTRRMTTLAKWSALYRWQERTVLFDYDREQARLEMWQERREQLAEMDWQQPLKIRNLIFNFIMLAVEARDHAAWATAFQKYDEMMRLAASEPTAHINLTGPALRSLLGSMEAIVNGRAAGAGDEPYHFGSAEGDAVSTA